MRKISLVIILATLLLLSIAGTQLINQAKANPYRYFPHVTEISPPKGTQAPIISIHTPQNGSAFPRNVIPLTFDLIIPKSNGEKSIGWIEKLYYRASWKSNDVPIIERGFGDNTSFSIDLYITSGGNLSITIYAVGIGEYETRTELTDMTMNHYYNHFEMNSSSTVSFIQDFLPPRIEVLSPQNSSYSKSDVELDLTANEVVSQILYCLDGNQNQTTTANATLTSLTIGTHNVTLYVADLAGNMGVSETISFTVTKPEPFLSFPISTIATVSGAIALTVVAGLLIYFKKHRRSRNP